MHPDDQIDQKLTPQQPASLSAEGASSVRMIGRHRAAVPPRRGVRALLGSTPVRVALATGVTCCLGAAAVASAPDTDEVPTAQVAEAVADRALADDVASRALERSAAPTPASPSPSASPTVSPSASPTAKPSASPTPKKTPAKPSRPTPVAGLTQAQMDNAKVIVDVGVDLKLPRQGLVVAVATAMQESTLLNYASGVLPESQDYPHQAIGWDHDSVGLFQQRPSSGWGTVRDLMRPAYAAQAFYEALLEVPGWQEMSLTLAAQAVQISAYPYAYAQHEERAATVVAALT
ncbi:hypothetical protein C1I95_15745 [Micromonospora craterilacus]|uniref:Peptidase M23 n=1 Tax=Micromonospora craterilacus TaxID=1655439 RepID=A0A2W2FQI6_9ACTN|nr:hypothetical protein [Micromonospora craterilacus]PZG17334.1 hypothetical protein C1I95_15745 [Micromonospora craterilacus]